MTDRDREGDVERICSRKCESDKGKLRGWSAVRGWLAEDGK